MLIPPDAGEELEDDRADPRDCSCCSSGLCRWAGQNDHDDY